MTNERSDDSDRPPLTIERFCHRNLISRSFYFTLKKAGLGPAEMRIGRLVRIDRAAEREWKAKMSAGAAAEFRTPVPERDDHSERKRSRKKHKRRDK